MVKSVANGDILRVNGVKCVCGDVDASADVMLSECCRMIMNVRERSEMFENDPRRAPKLWTLKCGMIVESI